MTFALELAFAPRVGLEVSPALVAFGELLMLPLPAMREVIDAEVEENPALDRTEAGECPFCRATPRIRCPVCAPPARPGGGAGSGGDWVAALPAAESDVERLVRAVRMETAAADAPIVEYVIGSLDQHGLLDRPCAQLAAELAVDESRVARVLDVVRSVGPPGVGAVGVAECLLLQLDACSLSGRQVELARAALADHLPALARGHFSAIAAVLGVSPAEVRGVLELVRQRLRPYPAFHGTGCVDPPHVVPDLVVRDDGGEPAVELVEPALTRLTVRGTGQTGRSVAQARAFLTQLHDRWQTLWRVADCAVGRQRGFVRSGPAALVPLTRAEVAVTLDLHESTVSRAVADKHVLLPDRSVVPLAAFFGTGGGVDEELRKLIAAAEGPVSDQRLADLLGAAGYPIARRTVAKHRARLGFGSAALR